MVLLSRSFEFSYVVIRYKWFLAMQLNTGMVKGKVCFYLTFKH